jgi:hypothetical protein
MPPSRTGADRVSPSPRRAAIFYSVLLSRNYSKLSAFSWRRGVIFFRNRCRVNIVVTADDECNVSSPPHFYFQQCRQSLRITALLSRHISVPTSRNNSLRTESLQH